MPHFVSVLSVQPLDFKVTEWYPVTGYPSIQLTGEHMHVQPIIARYSDGSVWVSIFDPTSHTFKSANLIPGNNSPNIVIEDFKRVPVPHIPRPENELLIMEDYKNQRLNMKPYLITG